MNGQSQEEGVMMEESNMNGTNGVRREPNASDRVRKEIEHGKVFSVLLLHHGHDDAEVPPTEPEREWLDRLERRRDACQGAEALVRRMQDEYDRDPDGGWIVEIVWESPANSSADWSLYANGMRVAQGSIGYLVDGRAMPEDPLETAFRGAIETNHVERLSHQAMLAAEAALRSRP